MKLTWSGAIYSLIFLLFRLQLQLQRNLRNFGVLTNDQGPPRQSLPHVAVAEVLRAEGETVSRIGTLEPRAAGGDAVIFDGALAL